MRRTLHALGLADSPPHPKPSASTSPRKRGEVTGIADARCAPISDSIFKQPRRFRCKTVIARSEATKQSMAAAKDGLLRFARNDEESRHTFTPSRRDAPESLINLSPLEGVGNAGCPLHPRPRVHLVLVERTRVTTSTPESPGIPARNGFNGFLRAPR